MVDALKRFTVGTSSSTLALGISFFVKAMNARNRAIAVGLPEAENCPDAVLFNEINGRYDPATLIIARRAGILDIEKTNPAYSKHILHIAIGVQPDAQTDAHLL